jgi:hypothetical protein
MMVIIKNSLFLCFIMLSYFASAQHHVDYKYHREIDGIKDNWHSITIPNDVFSKINKDFSDLRLIGVKEDGDTIEAPYILKILADTYHSKSINFKLINQVKSDKGYYYTFEIGEQQFINNIDLDFSKSNFDWFVKLEGSQDQQEWFTILEKSRILSLKNNFASYDYTFLKFDQVKYKYVRLFIPVSTNPAFISASISKKVIKSGNYELANIVAQKIEENKELDQTEIYIEVEEFLPISYIKLNVEASYDYYRPITIQYVVDSIKNNTGWHYVYSSIVSSTLSSIDGGIFMFPNTTMKHLKIIIKNGDNEPLDYGLTHIRGDVHQLIGRFNESASYYLYYGNIEAFVPNYDINRFETKIPDTIGNVVIGNEVELTNPKIYEDEDGLIKDDLWLWAIMIIVIFILGWFSLKMLKDK